MISPHLLNFGDEKIFKWTEIFKQYGRKDPMTGILNEVILPPYFCNSYCIMGFITINCMKYLPCLYSLGFDNHDSGSYMAFIINAVGTGWLQSKDFIVVDNAILHLGGHADGFADFLWNVPGIEMVRR